MVDGCKVVRWLFRVPRTKAEAAERVNTSNRFENLAIAGVKINIPIFTCDATAIKTAARNNVTLYKMQGPIVQQKWGGYDIKKALP